MYYLEEFWIKEMGKIHRYLAVVQATGLAQSGY